MEHLARAGYLCLTLRDALDRWTERRARQRAVVLTFDDGYDNFYQHAYPILSRHRFAATVFVVTGEVGGASRWDPGYATPLMNWDQLRELTLQGIEIGSHTVNHVRLTQLSTAAAKLELETSRRALEQKLGFAATSFAYPYGDHNEDLEKLVAETGYLAACSTNRGNLHSACGRFRLKRVPVDEFTSLPRLRRRLSPLYDLTCRWRRLSRHRRGNPR